MRLTESSLEFAKKHIERFYDSDFFAKPFEFSAIWASWEVVKEFLLNTDLEDLEISPNLSYAAPKPNQGFRIVHQLDPLNSLIYTALAREIAENIENRRIPIEENIACSYRIEIDEERGSFFGSGNGYNKFILKSRELAEKYNYVLVADITDFYNQIYIHRLQNSISSCGNGLDEIASEIEKFITRLNNKVSKGIPVGPAGSIIFAEACLIDIDEFILENDFEFTRYVDDFRIFSNSKINLLHMLEKLSYYMYSNHRMSISSAKTEIMTTNIFIDNHLQDPTELEKNRIHDALEELNLEVNFYPDIEPFDIDDLPPEDRIRIQAEALRSLLDNIIDLGKLDLGLARHILRRAGTLRSRSIYRPILENFDFFAPVIRDVIIYLERVTNDLVIERNLDLFLNIIKQSEVKNLPFISYWLGYFFLGFPSLERLEIFGNF